MIFLKCKIRLIYVRFSCKRKKWGEKMSGNFAIKGGGGGPLMANAILNFHFDFLNPSLILLSEYKCYHTGQKQMKRLRLFERRLNLQFADLITLTVGGSVGSGRVGSFLSFLLLSLKPPPQFCHFFY